MDMFEPTWKTIQEVNERINATTDVNELNTCAEILKELTIDVEEANETLCYLMLNRRIRKSMHAIQAKYNTNTIQETEEEEEPHTPRPTIVVQEEESNNVDSMCALLVGVFVIFMYGLFLIAGQKHNH